MQMNARVNLAFKDHKGNTPPNEGITHPKAVTHFQSEGHIGLGRWCLEEAFKRHVEHRVSDQRLPL